MVAALIGVALAVGTELLQLFTGGDAEVGDVVSDLIGMSAALFAWSARERLIAPRLGVFIAILLLVASLRPLLHALSIERYRASIAPDLIRFDSVFWRDLISSYDPIEIVAAPAGWAIAGPVLKFQLGGPTAAGVGLNQPIDDWRGYSTLVVDLFVDGAKPLPITVAVLLGRTLVNRHRDFVCAPGPNRLELPLEGLFDRDAAHITMVVVNSGRSDPARVVNLGRVGLQR